MAETICGAVKPRSHKLTRGFSILILVVLMRIMMMMMTRTMMYEDDNDVDADDHNMEMKKPESKVILSNVEASGVESVDSSVVTLKSSYGYCYCCCCCSKILLLLLTTVQ